MPVDPELLAEYRDALHQATARLAARAELLEEAADQRTEIIRAAIDDGISLRALARATRQGYTTLHSAKARITRRDRENHR